MCEYRHTIKLSRQCSNSEFAHQRFLPVRECFTTLNSYTTIVIRKRLSLFKRVVLFIFLISHRHVLSNVICLETSGGGQICEVERWYTSSYHALFASVVGHVGWLPWRQCRFVVSSCVVKDPSCWCV